MLDLLPDELLLQITFKIQGNKSLANLALTHRAFRSVVHEALVRIAIIPVRSIPHYITLLSHHPLWANPITDVELRDSSTEIGEFTFSPQDVRSVNSLISRLWTGRQRDRVRRALRIGYESQLVWTLLLFAALPNAKALRIEPAREDKIPNAYRFLLQRWEYTEKGFWTPLMIYAQSRIQSLTVRAPSDIYDSISVSDLTSCKILIVDGECLRPAGLHGIGSHQKAMLERIHLTGSLPLHLETLHVYGDERTMPWQWLRELQWHQVQNRFGEAAFTHLQVRLFFNIPCHTLARFLVYNLEPQAFQNADVLMLLQIWEQSCVDFQSLFRDPQDACDAFSRPELYARGILPEAYLAELAKANMDTSRKYRLEELEKGEAWRKHLSS